MENQRKNSLIRTFSDDIYIIRGKTPDELYAMIEGMDDIRMPNGSYIHRKSISAIQSYEDYSFQTDQKARHRKGQYLKGGEWNDNQGPLGIDAHLERITGELKTALPTGSKQLKA